MTFVFFGLSFPGLPIASDTSRGITEVHVQRLFLISAVVEFIGLCDE